MTSINLIVAVDRIYGLGKAGHLPWHLLGDMRHFKEVTTRVKHFGKVNAVVMGRRTWESLPNRYRPLPERLNAVLTRSDVQYLKGVKVYHDLRTSLDDLVSDDSVEAVYIIGGAQIYAAAMEQKICEKIFMTFIDHDFSCDVFFPFKDLSAYQMISRSATIQEQGYFYVFQEYCLSSEL